jgi:hypothetical protein
MGKGQQWAQDRGRVRMFHTKLSALGWGPDLRLGWDSAAALARSS